MVSGALPIWNAAWPSVDLCVQIPLVMDSNGSAGEIRMLKKLLSN